MYENKMKKISKEAAEIRQRVSSPSDLILDKDFKKLTIQDLCDMFNLKITADDNRRTVSIKFHVYYNHPIMTATPIDYSDIKPFGDEKKEDECDDKSEDSSDDLIKLTIPEHSIHQLAESVKEKEDPVLKKVIEFERDFFQNIDELLNDNAEYSAKKEEIKKLLNKNLW